ncbi:MAG: DinB family protein [Balneolaceae bacterium]|nr:DinB family protein [Balneolaceae bacterium]
MPTEEDQALRKRLVRHLNGGEAFSPIDRVLERVSLHQVGIVPDGLPYSFYQQFWHIRFAQYDILEYCRGSAYQAPEWPDDYWPEVTAPESGEEWKKLKERYFEDRRDLREMILDPSNDLFKPFASDHDHTLLREAELVIEHTAYHTGQLYVIERLVD